MHNPLDQFNLQIYYPFHIAKMDMSLTNAGLLMLIASFSAIALMWLLTRKMQVVPHIGQLIVEKLYFFIRSMIQDTIGNEGYVLIPFVASLFIFILFGNLLGLFPYSFTFTSHLSIVGVIAVLGSVTAMVIGICRQGVSWFRIFFPKKLPLLLAPLIIPIEIISFLSKPFSLTMRLVMNMTVGHIMLEVVAGFVFALGVAGLIPLLFTGVLILFEIFIAILQAYIFTVLSCIYLSQAFNNEE